MTAPTGLAALALDAYNRHDLAGYKRLHAPDARIGFAGIPGDIGIEVWLSTLGRLFTALPDLNVRPVTLLTDDATAILELHQTGTHTGVLLLEESDRGLLATDADQIPPTGRTVDVHGVVVLTTTADGEVSGERHHWPRHWLLENLGLLTFTAIPNVRFRPHHDTNQRAPERTSGA